jgi:hypothetical protein
MGIHNCFGSTQPTPVDQASMIKSIAENNVFGTNHRGDNSNIRREPTREQNGRLFVLETREFFG